MNKIVNFFFRNLKIPKLSILFPRKQPLKPNTNFTRKGIELRPGEEFKLPSLGRIDYEALRDGYVKVKYSAVDPLWDNDSISRLPIVNLRQHMMLLWSASVEFAQIFDEWTVVSENLRLAASINDIYADTDLQGDSSWCAPAAEYDSMNSELTEKYLAVFTVFSLTWTAYEGAIDIISAYYKDIKQQRGAKGREIMLKIGDSNFVPYIRDLVYLAVGTRESDDKFFRTPEMRRILRAGSLAGIAAEHLREFRNAVIHGDIRKPEPLDWGEGSAYSPNNDPNISQFHHNIRLLLIIIQICMIKEHRMNKMHLNWVPDEDWSISTESAIRNMHAKSQERDQVELIFE